MHLVFIFAIAALVENVDAKKKKKKDAGGMQGSRKLAVAVIIRDLL